MIPAILDALRGLHTPSVLLLAAAIGVPFGLIALVFSSTTRWCLRCRRSAVVIHGSGRDHGGPPHVGRACFPSVPNGGDSGTSRATLQAIYVPRRRG